MSQRNSEYARKDLDLYETPEWVTAALLPHLDRGRLTIWEPCAGNGKMARMLGPAHGYYASDIQLPNGEAIGFGNRPATIVAGVPIWQCDFLTEDPFDLFDGIVTNPPFGREGPKMLRRALELTYQSRWCHHGFVAMLFPMDFDAAPGRRDLFQDLPAWSKKIVLTKRIVWFERTDGKKEAPSMHHAWYIWDWRHNGPPTIAYGP